MKLSVTVKNHRAEKPATKEGSGFFYSKANYYTKKSSVKQTEVPNELNKNSTGRKGNAKTMV